MNDLKRLEFPLTITPTESGVTIQITHSGGAITADLSWDPSAGEWRLLELRHLEERGDKTVERLRQHLPSEGQQGGTNETDM